MSIMKIYGIKLSSRVRYVHPEVCEICDEGEMFVHPEDSVSPACHLYEDYKGVQYIGFELSLMMPTETMNSLLKKAGKVYTVNEF